MPHPQFLGFHPDRAGSLNGGVSRRRSGAAAASGSRYLQLKCACGNHASDGECRSCQQQRLQQKSLSVTAADDALEQQADQVAESLGREPAVPMAGREPAQLSRSVIGAAPAAAAAAPDIVHDVLRSPGLALDARTRDFFGSHLGHDFSAVRVHTDAQAAASARALGAAAYTAGGHVVFDTGRFDPVGLQGRKLLAHELTHVVQQGGAAAPAGTAIQRKVILGGKDMAAKDRAAFLKAHKWTNAALAQDIMDDMAAAGDGFDFKDAAELQSEIDKRLSTVAHMKESQVTTEKVPGDKRSAFGYPFTGASLLYGPRVNYAAREYWEPAVPDAYAVRTDKAKNAALKAKPRHERCTVYADPCGSYGWKLSKKGQADAYHAIAYLFAPQPPHKRSLLHCDYLISLVNFMSLADSIGATEFNKRVAAFGADKIVLRYNAFTDLHITTFERTASGDFVRDKSGKVKPRAGLGSTQRVRPSNEADLVLGDHVVFFNHLAYDLINEKIGNAWRLENAVLVSRAKGKDVFLGHGSGYKTADDMRSKLAEEFNDVADKALGLVAKTKSPNKAAKTAAAGELSASFPRIKEVAGDWRVQGVPGLLSDSSCSRTMDEKLRRIKPSEVLGPKSPCNPAQMNEVERPIESAK